MFDRYSDPEESPTPADESQTENRPPTGEIAALPDVTIVDPICSLIDDGCRWCD
jgi:hypothetical protein